MISISRLASLGIAVLCCIFSLQSLQGQATWQFETTVAPISLQANGSAILGPDTLPGSVNSGGFYSIPAVDAEFAVSANRDVMIGLSSSPAEAPLRILTKRPASLSVADLAGQWQYREYA
ncbi:MAG: hypothetical protein ACO3RV_03965, partial [Luteolibacter sp.]